MSVIADLERKLKTAKRTEARMARDAQEVAAEYNTVEDLHRRAKANVDELERAISLLRNNLKQSAISTDEKVVSLKSK